MCIYLRTYINITVKGKESMDVRGNEGKHGEGWEEEKWEELEKRSLTILLYWLPKETREMMQLYFN